MLLKCLLLCQHLQTKHLSLDCNSNQVPPTGLQRKTTVYFIFQSATVVHVLCLETNSGKGAILKGERIKNLGKAALTAEDMTAESIQPNSPPGEWLNDDDNMYSATVFAGLFQKR